MYFEEFSLSQSVSSSSKYRVTKEEIINYAKCYDPQFMHIDEEKAEKSHFNGLIAAGLHTMSVGMKLLIELNLLGNEVICGVSIDRVRFIRPVYREDVLTLMVKIIGLEDHPEEKGKGYVTFRLFLRNQDEKIVLVYNTKALVKRKTIKSP